jgi:ATP-dependent DNA helicase RecG
MPKNAEECRRMPKSSTLAKTIIAFSNTGGGKLIIGVNDQGQIIGLNPDINIFELKDKVASIVYETCYPTVLPDIYTTTVDEQLLLIIEVYRGNLLPYYLKNKGKVFISGLEQQIAKRVLIIFLNSKDNE